MNFGKISAATIARTAALALALLKALPQPEKNQPAIELLETKAQKLKKRQDEAKAHKRNLRRGKK